MPPSAGCGCVIDRIVLATDRHEWGTLPRISEPSRRLTRERATYLSVWTSKVTSYADAMDVANW